MDAGLTVEAFAKLLKAFDADRQRAGEKYEDLRRILIRFFEWRGAPFPEDHTDETFNRVARKLDEGVDVKNIGGYCYEVARLVCLEALKGPDTKRSPLESINWQATAATATDEALEKERTGVDGEVKERLDAALADGTQEKIGKIVNQRLPVEVLSYDPEVGAVVPKKVVGWFDNGRTDGFLQFAVARPAGNGRAQFACTPNHQIRTPGGWREASDLRVGDRVMQALPHHLSAFQWEVILGGLMGDGHPVGATGVHALVHASSVGAYSPGPSDRAVDESWPTAGIPTSPCSAATC